MSTNTFTRATNSLGAQLHQDRLQGVLTDITLQVGPETFPAHRLILENASPFFDTLFLAPGNVFRIDEQFVHPSVMSDLLTYFYTGEITLTATNAHALCIAALFMDEDELIAACEKHLCRTLSAGDMVALTILSANHPLNNLLARCAVQLCRNPPLLDDARLMQLTKNGVERLVFQLAQTPEGKENVFELINKWVQHDSATRTESAESLRRSASLSIEQFRLQNNSHLFCIGGSFAPGRRLSSVSRFNPETKQWQTMSPMANEREQFSGVVLGTKIYICGTTRGLDRFDNTRFFAVYDCLADTWQRLPRMPFCMDNIEIATTRGRIYLTGEGGLHTTYQYTPEDGSWQPIEDMNVGDRSQLLGLGGYIYALGGTYSGTKQPMERYDPTENKWKIVSPSNYEHTKDYDCDYSGFTAAAHNGRIYVYAEAGFEVYDPQNDTWQKLSSAETAATSGTTLVSFNGELLLIGGYFRIGGYVGGNASAAVYAYDVYADQWSRLADMDVARGNHCSFVVDTSAV